MGSFREFSKSAGEAKPETSASGSGAKDAQFQADATLAARNRALTLASFECWIGLETHACAAG
jgi:hypothetical protein